MYVSMKLNSKQQRLVKYPALRYVKLASKPLKSLIGKFSLNWKPILHMKLRWNRDETRTE